MVAAVGVRVVGVDSVGGDSGVAAVARDRLVGIVSGIVVVGLVGDLGRKEGMLITLDLVKVLTFLTYWYVQMNYICDVPLMALVQGIST